MDNLKCIIMYNLERQQTAGDAKKGRTNYKTGLLKRLKKHDQHPIDSLIVYL